MTDRSNGRTEWKPGPPPISGRLFPSRKAAMRALGREIVETLMSPPWAVGIGLFAGGAISIFTGHG